MRYFELVCPGCGGEDEDLVDGTPGPAEYERNARKCKICLVPMRVKAGHAPLVDARRPFYVSGFGRSFSSHLEMERYARAHGKTVMEGSKALQLPVDTVEERLEKNLGERRREAIQKVHYRLRHGYKDHPPLPKESDL